MYRVIDAVLSGAGKVGLREHITAIVRALLAAHLVEPRPRKVLEQEFPFFDAPMDASPSDQSIFRRVRQLLEEWREQITPADRDLATWVVPHIIESMVHAAVIESPKQVATAAIEQATTDAVMGYLTLDRAV